jgi:hypothetical protein
MHDPVMTHFYIRTTVALVVAMAVMAACFWFTIGPGERKRAFKLEGKEMPIPMENFIAFNITVFIVLGFAMTIAATDRWPAACLWAGAVMLGGGIIGVLFGIPTAADAQSKSQTRVMAVKVENDSGETAAAVGPVTPARAHTLMSDTASWISKFLAGAGFAQAHNIFNYFVKLSRSVANYVVFPVASTDPTALGAGLLLYFTVLGFFCGLLLPYYFVKNLPS